MISLRSGGSVYKIGCVISPGSPGLQFKLTRFTKVKFFLHQITHQPKKRDEAAQSGADNVEIVDGEGRHGCG